jgi:hypothetical protein
MIELPFPARVNPHAAAARAQSQWWVREQRLVSRPAAARRFAEADFAQFAAQTYPAVAQPALFLIADWFAWLFLLDDQFDDGLVGRDPERVKSLMADVMALLDAPVDGPSPIALDAAPPIITAFADLWRRTARTTTAHWRRRFADHVVAGGLAAFWEADNRVSGRIPDVHEYVEQRRHTGAIYVCMDLIEPLHGIELPPQVYQDPAFQGALQAACDVVCWTNDLYSLDKERSLGENHNLVCVVEHHLGLGRAAAVDRVVADIDARTRDYESCELGAARCHPEYERELAVCLDGMRSWMRGNLDWSASTPRYLGFGSHSAASSEPEYLEPVADAPSGGY